ncbi:MAG: hypothetical protein IT442_16695 [Phycisphaeraceae bacterium]|nr:hypothetical protein [Phycisphaeraceae bacterium]
MPKPSEQAQYAGWSALDFAAAQLDELTKLRATLAGAGPVLIDGPTATSETLRQALADQATALAAEQAANRVKSEAAVAAAEAKAAAMSEA